MKKILAAILTALCVFSATLTVGCKSDKGTIIIAVPDGAPTLALYSVMDSVNSIAGYEIRYKVLSGAENIGKTLVSGQADCAVMPVNVAAKLYNTGNDLKLTSVNVFGVLYMVGGSDLESFDALKGKVVVTIGKNATPDISLKLILDGNGVEYVDSDTARDGFVALSYAADAPTAMRMLAAGVADYAILGEPQVTVACKNLGVKVVMDVQSEWSKIAGENSFTQAGLVANEKVYSNAELAEGLLTQLSKNAEYILKEPEKVGKVIRKYGSSLSVEFTEDILKRCNLGCERASEIKTPLENYFNAILNYDPSFIGGKLPADGFYY